MFFKALLVVVLALAIAVVVGLRRNRRANLRAHGSSADVRDAGAAKSAAEQAVITRQGGQGAGQGGVGGGMGF